MSNAHYGPMPHGGGPGAYHDPQAPYGRAPDGRPYSDKSKVVAGLLQILVAGLGIGRFYLGHTRIGAMQLALTAGGFILYFVLIFGGMFVGVAATESGGGSAPGAIFASAIGAGFLALLAAVAGSIWTFVDGILILVDKVPDAAGRPLRS